MTNRSSHSAMDWSTSGEIVAGTLITQVVGGWLGQATEHLWHSAMG